MAKKVIESGNDSVPQNTNPSSFGTLYSLGGGLSAAFSSDVETLYSASFYSNKAQPDPFTVSDGVNMPIPTAIANQYALYNFRGLYGGLSGDISLNYFDSDNNNLMGGNAAKELSVSKVIEFFNTNYPKINYKPADFLYSKFYKKIPLNHMITLRRFPIPVNDNIYDLAKVSAGESGGTTGKTVSDTQVAGVTAVTYMGETAGNKLDEILNFTYGLNWKEITSEMESIDTGDGGYTQQPFYSKIGGIGRAIADTAKGVSAGDKAAAANITTGDIAGTTYANYVLGPVNVVDSTVIRNRGLTFSNDMTLNFEYELKSLNYVNPKIAMIDIISNMLTMTTNNAQFFGGGHRYYGSGGKVAEQFGDLSKLRRGDFAGYVGSVTSDVENGFKGAYGNSSGGFSLGDLFNGGVKTAKTFLGNMLGGLLGKQAGGATGIQATRAFISSEPTGNWHVTIGNPLNPIVSMGNMYCDNAVMTLGQGLGYDDFPMEVKFAVSVKHGKPRDKGDIENMFNAGRGRIYASAQNSEDILNLQGIDVQTYGSVQDIGTSDLSSTQSGNTQSNNKTPASSVNDQNSSLNTKNSNPDAEYLKNLTKMMINS